MAIREILEVPDPRLKTISTPVEAHEFGDDLRTLVADMFETMYDAPGIGLAAIQVGVPKRVLVIDLQPEDSDAEPVECGHGSHSHTHPATKPPAGPPLPATLRCGSAPELPVAAGGQS